MTSVFVLNAANQCVGLHVVSFHHTVTPSVMNFANVTFKVKREGYTIGSLSATLERASEATPK